MIDTLDHPISITQLTDAYRRHDLAPVALCEAMLERIARREPTLNALACQNSRLLDDARASRERWQREQPIGPLDGVPLIVKDNLMLAGMPAAWGNAALAQLPVEHDELPVARLRAAGALFIGKANTPEFAVDGYTASEHFGVTRHPLDTRLTPGGSSGGVAAAVVAGYASAGIGTDGGGSIRRPAGYCGLVGLKPGIGHVPRGGGLPQVLRDF